MPTLTLTKKYQTYPEYKNSGVEWIGKIPKGWGVEKLKYVAPLVTNKVTKENLQGTYVALENVESKTGKHISSQEKVEPESIVNTFKDTDVLFGKLRPYLAKVFAPDFSGTSTSEFLVLRPGKQIIKKYLFYRVLSQEFIDTVNDSTYGAQMPRANWSFIGNLVVTLPSLNEQTEIINFLDEKTAQIEKIIEKKEKLIEFLQEKRTAAIQHAVTKGLDPKAPLVPSGIEWIGKIPKGWGVQKLKTFSRIELGKMLQNENTGGDYLKPYLRAQNINWFTTNLDSVHEMWFSPHELKRHKIAENDLLVSEGGEVGRTAIWQNELSECYIQNSINRVSVGTLANPHYILYHFYALGKSGVFNAVVNRVSIAHLTREKLKEVFFALPKKETQEKIAKYLDGVTVEIDNAIQRIQKSVELLQEFKSSLISNVVTGKVKIN